MPIVLSGYFLKGGFIGAVLGNIYFLCGPVGHLETEKVLSAAGSRPFSGQLIRLLRSTTFRYFFAGGLALSGYHYLLWYIRHHDEANPRPAYLDHVAATTTILTASSLFIAKRPYYVGVTAFFSVMLVSPFSYWLMKNATIGTGRRAPNIFYQNDCTDEEIERYRHQDMIEEAAAIMKIEHGYGYCKRGDQSFF